MLRGHVRASILKSLVLGLAFLLIPGLAFWYSPHLFHVFTGARPGWMTSGPTGLIDYLFPLIMLGMVGAGVVCFVWVALLLLRPTWHPVYRRLSAFGPAREVAAAIDAELARRDEVVRVGSIRSVRPVPVSDQTPGGAVLLSRSWLLQLTDFGLRVARLEDVVWVRKVSFHAVVAGRPTGAALAYAVEVKVRRGNDELFRCSKEEVDRLLLELLTRLPWVRSGLDERWERQWEGDRPALVADVQRERERIQAGPGEGWAALVRDKVRQAQEHELRRAFSRSGPGEGRPGR
jgi:hypothetical protein